MREVMVMTVNGVSLLRVLIQPVSNSQGFVRGFNVVLRNYRQDGDLIVQSFLATNTDSETIGAAYNVAYRWSHILADTIECDHQDLPEYSHYLKGV